MPCAGPGAEAGAGAGAGARGGAVAGGAVWGGGAGVVCGGTGAGVCAGAGVGAGAGAGGAVWGRACGGRAGAGAGAGFWAVAIPLEMAARNNRARSVGTDRSMVSLSGASQDGGPRFPHVATRGPWAHRLGLTPRKRPHPRPSSPRPSSPDRPIPPPRERGTRLEHFPSSSCPGRLFSLFSRGGGWGGRERGRGEGLRAGGALRRRRS
jgi:hypothetical protein